MAMTVCKECGSSISDKAATCPQCGAKVPKKTSKLALTLAGLVLIAVLYSVFDSTTSSAPAPMTAAELENEREFQQVVGVLRALKSSLHNPSSFELVSAIKMNSGALCVQYRGTNAFNAVVTNQLVVTEQSSSSAIEDWNRLCGGQTGKSFNHARHAL